MGRRTAAGRGRRSERRRWTQALRNGMHQLPSIRGTVANGTFAPDLTHLMSRDVISSGVAANTRDNLMSWVNDPRVLKPGARMPSMKLTRDEVSKIVDYLLTLK